MTEKELLAQWVKEGNLPEEFPYLAEIIEEDIKWAKEELRKIYED